MLNHPLLSAVARSRRRKILPPLAAIVLVGSLMLLPAAAGALPPPGGGGSGGPGANDVISLSATSYLGTVTIYNGLSAKRAMLNSPIVLSGTNTNDRQPRLEITERSWCAYGSRVVTVGPFERAGWHAVPDLASQCPDGLYQATVTARAFDSDTGLSTGKLTIDVYGPQFYDDRLPVFGPW